MGYLLLLTTGCINIFAITYYFANKSRRESQFLWTLRFGYLTSHDNPFYCQCFNVVCLVLKNWGETMWPVSGFLSLCYCTDHCQLTQVLPSLRKVHCLPCFVEPDTVPNHLVYCICICTCICTYIHTYLHTQLIMYNFVCWYTNMLKYYYATINNTSTKKQILTKVFPHILERGFT
jgi:hypothetical protein